MINNHFGPQKSTICFMGYIKAIFFLIFLCGCDIKSAENTVQDSVQEAVSAIDNATDQLHDESANWQMTLQQLENGLDKDAKDLIDNDIQSLVTETIARAGIEVRCEADFINETVAEDLQAIKAKLLNQSPPLRRPEFCQSDPPVFNLTPPNPTSVVIISGYNFDANRPFIARVRHKDGTIVSLPLNTVALPNRYTAVISLQTNGTLTPSDLVEIDWNGETFATINAYLDQPICVEKQVTGIWTGDDAIAKNDLLGPYYPPQVQNGANGDFNGHGPDITVSATGQYTATKLTVTLQMLAMEKKKNGTILSGTSEPYVIFNAENGWVIESVVGSLYNSWHLAPDGQSNHSGPYTTSFGANEFVNSFSVVGDTKGKDVFRTSVTVALNPPTIIERQVANCVSPAAAEAMISSKQVNKEVAASLTNQLAPHMRIMKDALRFRNVH